MSNERVNIVADLLRRFSVPRSYAGDFYGDYARRILVALGEHDKDKYWVKPDKPCNEFNNKYSMGFPGPRTICGPNRTCFTCGYGRSEHRDEF